MLGRLRQAERTFGLAQTQHQVEAKLGFIEVYGDKADAAEITRDFGKRWNILTDMGIKLVPGGHPHHTTAEAAANAAREGNVSPEDVESITISRPGFQGFTGPQFPNVAFRTASCKSACAAASFSPLRCANSIARSLN